MGPIRKMILALLTLLAVTLLGTMGYVYLEGFSFFDAFWFTLQTIAMIGFGDILPKSPAGKIFTILLIIGGISTVAYAFGTIVGLIVEGQITDVVGRRKMEKKLASLENHIIICGAGRVGLQVVKRLTKENVPYVVIDKNEELIEKLVQEGYFAFSEDAIKDETLIRAGIERAWGLVTALPGDAENVFVTLTSKVLNPKIKVVARCDSIETEDKLHRAGADKVISPAVIGGRRMAISILKPVSVEFVETLIHKKNLEIEIEEVNVSSRSPLIGKTLRESEIRPKTGVMVVGIKRGEDVISNPSADDKILADDLLIVIGTRSQLAKLEELAAG